MCVTGLGMSISFQFLVQSIAPSPFILPTLHLTHPLPALLCVQQVPHSVIQSVRQFCHNHNHSFDSANKPAHLPGICFAHLLVHAPSSLETRTPTWEPSHPASLHHYIIQSFVTQGPQSPPPSCPLWHPWASNLGTLTPSHSASPACIAI